MTVAIVSSSVQKKSVKRELILTNVLRLAAVVMRKNIFNLLLFLFDAKFMSYGQKKYENCEPMSKMFCGSCNVTRFISRDFQNQPFTIK